MSKGTKIILGVVIGLIIFIGSIVGYIFSAKFTAERFEQAITAQDQSMMNTWAMMEQQLKMNGFTVKNYSKSFLDTIKAQANRYKNDKGSMMKWVKEASAQMSPDVHKKFMDAIDKAYSKKEAVQLQKISVSQEYKTFINATLKGTIAKAIFSYPTKEAQTIMNRVIKTKAVSKTWETQEDTVQNPF